MKIAKFLLVTIAFVVIASCINSTFADNKATPPILPPPKLLTGIDIWSVDPGAAAPQNINPVTVTFNVSQLANRGICGLNASNFNLSSIKVPQYGPVIGIKDLTQLDASRVPHICYYYIHIVPLKLLINQGYQYKWVKGAYSAQLNYIQNGQIVASKAFNFTV